MSCVLDASSHRGKESANAEKLRECNLGSLLAEVSTRRDGDKKESFDGRANNRNVVCRSVTAAAGFVTNLSVVR